MRVESDALACGDFQALNVFEKDAKHYVERAW